MPGESRCASVFELPNVKEGSASAIFKSKLGRGLAPHHHGESARDKLVTTRGRRDSPPSSRWSYTQMLWMGVKERAAYPPG